MAAEREKILYEAEFDENWKTYFYLQAVLVMVATVAGILFLPFWFAGWGSWYCRRSFESLHCRLGERSLMVGRGIFFRVERTIPLEKIQDLTLREGPLLKKFGLLNLQIETAGQSAPQGASEAMLVGLKDARGFRDRVLDQRDAMAAMERSPDATRAEPAAGTGVPSGAVAARLVELAEESNSVLREILQELKKT